MKLSFEIDMGPAGVVCSSVITGKGAEDLTPSARNALGLGALEIAKASLLAQRWGINIGNFDGPGLVPSIEAQQNAVEPGAFGNCSTCQHGQTKEAPANCANCDRTKPRYSNYEPASFEAAPATTGGAA